MPWEQEQSFPKKYLPFQFFILMPAA